MAMPQLWLRPRRQNGASELPHLLASAVVLRNREGKLLIKETGSHPVFFVPFGSYRIASFLEAAFLSSFLLRDRYPYGDGSSFLFETAPLTGLGIVSDTIDEGCKRTRRERHCR